MTEDRSADAAIRQRQPEPPADAPRSKGVEAALAQAEADAHRAPRNVTVAHSRLAALSRDPSLGPEQRAVAP